MAVAVIVYNSTIIIDQSFHTSNFLLLAVVNSNILSNHHPTSNNIFQTTKSNVLRGFDHHKSQSFPASAPKKCRTCRITCPLRNLKMLAGQSHNNPAQNYCQFFNMHLRIDATTKHSVSTSTQVNCTQAPNST